MADEKKFEQLNLDEEILAPYNHLIQIRGKQLREQLVRSFNFWLKVPDIQLKNAIDTMTMLHNASLLFDDVQDNSLTRRGLPSAHCVYGVALALNASAQITMKTVLKASELVPSREGAEIIAKQFIDALTGQGYEIYWRDNCVCPDEKTYLKMLTLKTGTMLLLGVKLIQLFSENKTKYDDFVMKLGLYLQLRDDYCNMGHEKDLEEMPGEEDVNADKDGYILEDITEGKFTLPAIYAMKTPEGPQVLSIMRQRTRDLELKKYCLSLLEKSGGMQYTRDLLMKMDKEVRAELATLGGNPVLEKVLDGLMGWKSEK
ncbi:terpene synthase-like [Danaus plexippus]|uniref:terpene synthase-like n=1 Tax=Danaus plexippus TaxID=13037 RepID=UPI002AAFF364|nr:terpene synthase-like [Danaus plexippus]